MLEAILNIIKRDGYISRSKIAEELGIDEKIISDGIDQLIRMGYLTQESTSSDCNTFCKSCPSAKSCSKEIVKTFKLTEKRKK